VDHVGLGELTEQRDALPCGAVDGNPQVVRARDERLP
jgi:hypothetical protein